MKKPYKGLDYLIYKGLLADRQSGTVEPPLTATSTQWSSLHKGHFLVDSPYIDSFCLNLSTMATFPVPEVAVVGKFNCTYIVTVMA